MQLAEATYHNYDYHLLIFFTRAGRQPVGLDVFIGAITLLMKGETNKATVVDIGWY